MKNLMSKPRFMMSLFYKDDFMLLNVFKFIFQKILEEKNPDLWTVVGQQGLPIDTWLTGWFLTLYIGYFPMELVVRIWDCFLVEGILIILTIACQIVLETGKILIEKSDIDDVYKVLCGYKSLKYIDLYMTDLIPNSI
jgi:hypothetical protein